jgi:hypothetical protein
MRNTQSSSGVVSALSAMLLLLLLLLPPPTPTVTGVSELLSTPAVCAIRCWIH